MYYKVIGTDCCLVSNERMRIGNDGSIGIGGGDTVIERYKFQTAEVAARCADIFNRDLSRQQSEPIYLTDGNLMVGAPNTLCFAAPGREVMRIDQSGAIVKLDIPYLVWCWLRTTAPVRAAKALWKGWA